MSTKAPKPNKLSFILYENKSAPRYYEVKKGFFRFVIYGLPIISLISLIVITVGGIYFKEIRLRVERKEPKFLIKLKEDNKKFLKEREELSILNNKLQSRLSGVSPTALQDKDFRPLTWSIFKPIPGQKDLSNSPVLAVEEIDAFPLNNETLFRFNLVNLTKENKKVAGFIHVLMKMNNQIISWPSSSMPQDEMQILFNKGESFATSRFRSTEAKFPIPKVTTKAMFWILVYSRTGDLMHKQIISREIKI